MKMKAWGSQASVPSTMSDGRAIRSDITKFWFHIDEPMKAEQAEEKRGVFRGRIEFIKKICKVIG